MIYFLYNGNIYSLLGIMDLKGTDSRKKNKEVHNWNVNQGKLIFFNVIYHPIKKKKKKKKIRNKD